MEHVLTAFSDEEEGRKKIAQYGVKDFLDAEKIIDEVQEKAFILCNDPGLITAIIYHVSQLIEKRVSGLQ
jgi:hypothetical protein